MAILCSQLLYCKQRHNEHLHEHLEFLPEDEFLEIADQKEDHFKGLSRWQVAF